MTPFRMPSNKVVKITAKTALRERKIQSAAVSLSGLLSLLIMSILHSIITINGDRSFYSYPIRSVLFLPFWLWHRFLSVL